MPRFIGRGREGVWFVPTLANPAAPSAAAVAAGTALHDQLKAYTGFTSSTDNIDNADYGSRFNKTLPGGESPDDSSLTIYAGDADTDPGEVIRAALPEGANGYVVWIKRAKTPASGQRADVFPIRVGGVNDDRTMDIAVRTFTVSTAIPDVPNKNVTLVA
jgi:hypothetical protein